jgi:glycosyltransferase involved in cell wall biosynthesis
MELMHVNSVINCEVLVLSHPKVSICIPTYKQPDFFRRALQSVFIQSFDDYEVIITDDSPDESVEHVVKGFQPNIKLKYYKNKERKGSPENWNEAIRLASGEYIKILHHDDWFPDKNSLIEFVKMLDENPNADFAFCSSLVCGPDQKVKYLHLPTEKQLNKLKSNPSYLFPKNIVGAPSATIYRSKLNKKFDTKLKWVVDIDFYISVLKDNKNFIFCPNPLVCTTDGASHQVTNECQNDKNIELFEWFYLYDKIKKYPSIDFRNFIFFWDILYKYKVRSIYEIKELGIQSPPHILEAIILLQKILYTFR